MFVLSWMLFHVIDKDSPLHGLTDSDLAESDALLVLNVSGVDDSSAQQLYARHVYSWRDVRWQHHRTSPAFHRRATFYSTTPNSTIW